MGCRPCCEPFRIVTRNWRSAAVWFWPPCCTDPKPRHCTKDTPRNWKNSTNTGFGPARESVGKSELQTLRSRRQLLQEALKHCAEESPALGWSCHPYGSSSSLKNWPCTENGARGRGTRADLESATTTTWRTISGGLTSSRKNMRTQPRKDQDGELWPGSQLPASRTTECSAFRQHVTALSNGCFYHHHHQWTTGALVYAATKELTDEKCSQSSSLSTMDYRDVLMRLLCRNKSRGATSVELYFKLGFTSNAADQKV